MSVVVGVALLALVGVFFLALRLASPAATHAAPVVVPTALPAPHVTPLPTTTLTGGTARWSSLAGGECFSPFTSPWAETFTVVDCTAPHQAQLVYATVLPGTASEAYPGQKAVVADAQKLCGQNGIINLAAAKDDTGVQVQAAYPASEEQWQSGQRGVYCFATLSSGAVMTGSIAGLVAGPAPTAAAGAGATG
ncbi:MAG TPA: septum formation family protein [Microbacteriaceae bacterium]|nr:septum formation family protein [Microbacteriaceae bacterium]